MRDYTPDQIADYFLAKNDADVGDLITNLKLQKLCYYAQGVATIARGGRPLFQETLEAWLHGPVVPSQYHRFKEHASRAIPAPAQLDLSIYTAADRAVLDDVYDYYGQYSAWRLRQMTHDEAPWKDAYDEGRGQGADITHDAMREFFATEVKPEYAQRYEELLKAEG